MINEHFAILAALLPIAGSASYAVDTFKGKTQPNRVSWLLWGIAPMIAFAAELVQHTKLESTLLTFAVGFGPLLVIFASFVNHKAYWKITKFDIFCGSISVLALVLWAITGKGNVAIFFSILADLFAAIPTMIKSYTHPKSESAGAFVTSVLGAGITLLTIKVWAFANYGFTLYIFLVTIVISTLILFPRTEKSRNKQSVS
jgi:energy-converting hydrogenase Eha subunit A